MWNFLSVLYWTNNHTKYALEALRLKASQLGLLTPRQAHRLKWSRFANRKGGQGKCISRDLRFEQIDKVSKECIRAVGAPDMNSSAIESSTKSTGPLLGLLQQSKQVLSQEAHSTQHTNKVKQQTFVTVLEQIHRKADVFTFKFERRYTCFPVIKNDLYNGVNVKQLHRWICRYRQNAAFYKY